MTLIETKEGFPICLCCFFKLVKNSFEEDGGREMEEKKRKEKEKEVGMKRIVRRG